MAVTSLVLGIVSAVMGLIPLTRFIAIIRGAVGLIFGIVGWRKANTREQAARVGDRRHILASRSCLGSSTSHPSGSRQ
jgi:hypothetical protein